MQLMPGLELSRRYFHEAVEPVLAAAFPGLRYGAALIGPGSEVQGFDDAMSTDHNWGPRVLLFLAANDMAALGGEVGARLEAALADDFLGWPTRIEIDDPTAHDAGGHGRRPASLRIEIHALAQWVHGWLGMDAGRDPDWRAWLGNARLLSPGEGALRPPLPAAASGR
jgi:hypothetical protein